ncbi:iron-containing alcohol dehydrogenase [Saccharicrinis fermentans]|uniref:Alcohol dehydrogenase 2 n=1 Tax=Saccharicrinis fermentans DSM 9555 = JCM 21142 TaxID=869213 RepID=W7YBV3_9BACT|nr:iron-containing alcohol dehydrogenase [Saccharicrinis fermentans]GAF01951.1 alcohol dehydrogenase 2 [Saccharicrinis fermentans DSM 9555 = JCM 21142]
MLEKRRIYLPPLSLVGPGVIADLAEEIKDLNCHKVLIVTDKILNELGVVKKVTDLLDTQKVNYVIFDEVKPNPTCANVNDALAVFKENGCDYILTIGGGSPQDCGKAVGILATNGGEIKDYEGINISKKKAIPTAAINTTAGTASEVTINYVITDEERKVKMVMVDKNCLVSIAVNDPELMLNKPAPLTAATGMDALTHAIEAYVSVGAFPWSDHMALYAIELIAESLRDAVKDGKNLEARSKMAWAQFIAGQAFSNCGLGFVHSAAHQLGGQYNTPHGVANAVLLPHVERFNLSACPEKFAKIAKAMGVDTSTMSTEEAAESALDAISQLSKDVGIPSGIKELGAKAEDFELMAKNALADVCTGGNPKEISLEDAMAIYENAM